MRVRNDERPERVEFRGPAGRLVGLHETPASEPEAAAIVCHPHPLHQGTMQNTIVYRAARALRRAGLATLRFDFRGVGESEGEHHGEGGPGSEEDDAAAALDFLAERHPGLPSWAAGYSFGSRTVCGLAVRDERIRRLVLIAFPVAVYDCSCIRRVTQPGLLLFGSGDPFGTLTELAQAHPALPERLEPDEIPGADHFFRGRTPLVEERIHEYAVRALEEDRT